MKQDPELQKGAQPTLNLDYSLGRLGAEDLTKPHRACWPAETMRRQLCVTLSR